jgi:hypothetical protein
MRTLSTEGLGYLNYLHGILAQPLGSWEGFYTPQSPSMNFALRYQLAFGSYAVALLSQRTPAYRAPYAEAIRGAIEKMLDVATWGYWRTSPDAGSLAESGHVSVLLSPHQHVPAGPPSDPIARDNLQYSGHLSTMLGLYEKVSGDGRYDNPFTLQDPESGVNYTYTHSDVAGRIYKQMERNRFGGVCCEKGMAYVPCNNHALASNTLHDALHGTRYSDTNRRWLRTVRQKMVLRGPAVRGVFGTTYVRDIGIAAPVAFNFTDAWGLAFMLPFDRLLVRKLYGRFKKKVAHAGADRAYVDSSTWSEKAEISDVAINTGFGLVLAKGVGDTGLADVFRRYSADAFGAGWRGSQYLYSGAERTLHATALYAFAEAMEAGGADFTALFRQAPDRSSLDKPYLESVSGGEGRVGVFQAEYDVGEKALHIGLRQVADPAELREAGLVQAELTIGNVTGPVHAELNGAPMHEAEYVSDPDGKLRLAIPVPPDRDVSWALRQG